MARVHPPRGAVVPTQRTNRLDRGSAGFPSTALVFRRTTNSVSPALESLCLDFVDWRGNCY